MPEFVLGVRALLIVVFASASFSKLRARTNLLELARSLTAMGVLARPYAAAALAFAEAGVAVALVVPGFQLAGLWGAAALLTVLTAGTGWMLAHGVVSVCRCFGRSEAPMSARHLMRNAVLLSLALSAAILASESVSGRQISPALVVAGGVGAVLGVLVVSLDDLVTLLAPLGTARGMP